MAKRMGFHWRYQAKWWLTSPLSISTCHFWEVLSHVVFKTLFPNWMCLMMSYFTATLLRYRRISSWPEVVLVQPGLGSNEKLQRAWKFLCHSTSIQNSSFACTIKRSTCTCTSDLGCRRHIQDTDSPTKFHRVLPTFLQSWTLSRVLLVFWLHLFLKIQLQRCKRRSQSAEALRTCSSQKTCAPPTSIPDSKPRLSKQNVPFGELVLILAGLQWQAGAQFWMCAETPFLSSAEPVPNWHLLAWEYLVYIHAKENLLSSRVLLFCLPVCLIWLHDSSIAIHTECSRYFVLADQSLTNFKNHEESREARLHFQCEKTNTTNKPFLPVPQIRVAHCKNLLDPPIPQQGTQSVEYCHLFNKTKLPFVQKQKGWMMSLTQTPSLDLAPSAETTRTRKTQKEHNSYNWLSQSEQERGFLCKISWLLLEKLVISWTQKAALFDTWRPNNPENPRKQKPGEFLGTKPTESSTKFCIFFPLWSELVFCTGNCKRHNIGGGEMGPSIIQRGWHWPKITVDRPCPLQTECWE